MSEIGRRSLLPTATRAEVFSVADLVQDLRAGRIRIPAFPPGWNWSREQIHDLLDSIYRGYPIGSLLFWQRARPAERLRLGPAEILASERSDAWAVIDGRQRLTALFGTLAHPDPRPDPEDDFVAFFDASAARFAASPRPGRPLPDSWVPVARLLEAAELQDWLRKRPHFEDQEALRHRVLEAARRLREGRIAAYLIEAENEEVPREIYRRIHRGGSPMAESDVFDSIAGRPGDSGKMEDLEQEIAALGMGQDALGRPELLQCVMAVAAQEVHRGSAEQPVPEPPDGALAATAPALRSALVFLEQDARIRHLHLLPCSSALILLCRFFHFFPEPNARTRLLLVRWVWRGMLSARHDPHPASALRGSLRAIRKGEEEPSVQRLLELVPRTPPADAWWLGEPFDGRSAASRLAGGWLASLQPRDLEKGAKIDIKRLLDQDGAAAFRPLGFATRLAGCGSLAAARILHPAGFQVRRLVELSRSPHGDAREILASHAFGEAACLALRQGRWADAIAFRHQALRSGLDRLGARMAAWGKNDRPSLAFLLEQGKHERAGA